MKKFAQFFAWSMIPFIWVIIFLLNFNAKAQTPSCFWANKTGAVDYDYGRAVATDTSGHVYVAGHFYGTGDFDPGTGIINLVTKGGYDIFISKLDTAGNLIWLKQIGGADNDYVNEIVVDNYGQVYLTGKFSGTCDFDPADSTAFNLTSFGGEDVFISKLDSSGNLIWTNQIGGTSNETGNSLALLNNYNGNNIIYIAGTFSGNADFDPGAGTNNISSAGGTDIFFVRLDTAGSYISANTMGGSSDDEGSAIVIGLYYGYPYVYLTGSFSGTADLDPGSGTYNLTSSGGTDIFITRMGWDGSFISSRNIGGTGNDEGTAIAADYNSYYVYITGTFEDTVDFRPGSGTIYLYSAGGTDVFVLKMMYGTSTTWVSQIGGTENDYSNSIAVDASYNTYFTGNFSGTADFNPDVASYELSAQGLEDIFIEKLDLMGNLTWVKQMGEVGTDNGSDITIDASGNIYSTGYFSGTNVDFDPGTGSVYQSSSGSTDVFLQRLDGSGNYSWAKKMGSGSGNTVNALQIDGSGNVYTTGYFMGTADFDAGPSIYNLSSVGTYDIFISKVNSSGEHLWTKQIGSISTDMANSLAIDSLANIYITGYFYSTADFDPGPGIFNMTSAGGNDVFILKLDSAGNFIWAKQLGGSGTEQGNSIAIDTLGHIILAGNFYCCTAVDFDPGPETFFLTASSSPNVFICKLDTSGNFIWANSFIGLSYVNKIICNKKGNFYYTTGYFYSTTDFDPGAGTYNLTSNGLNDAFICKLDSAGNFKWARQMGGTDSDIGYSLAVDDSGFVYAGGSFSLTVDFDPGSDTFNLTSLGGTDLFLLKLDRYGNFIRVAHIGSDGSENVRNIYYDGSGNIYFAGNFGGADDFDQGPDSYIMTSAGKPDGYICKYDTAFDFLWAKRIGGSEVDMVYSFALDNSGNIYAAGYFGGTADLDPDNETYYLTADGATDIFTIKYHPVVFDAASTGVSCFGGNDGNGTVNIIEGDQPFTVNWDNGETTQTASALNSGSHYVTVTDAMGCAQVSDSVFVAQPTEIITNVTNPANISCYGGNDGTASVAATGGTGSFQYDWSTGDTTNSTGNLFAGTYYLTVTDSNSCTKNDSILISQPTAISTNTTNTVISCTGGTNGTATVNASGGTTPYSYLWNMSPAQITQTANTLKGQTYLVTVTDNNGCTKIDSVTLINPPLLTSTMTKTKVNCYGGNDGTATVLPSGGTSPYTYYWNIGQTAQTATALFPGNYAVNILDAMGCSSNNIVSIGQPTQPSLSLSGTSNTCYGGNSGTATANPSGGSTPYSYTWSTGAITKTITGLSAGTYYVTVSDSCSISGTDSISISQPLALSSMTTKQNIKCYGYNNGLATAIASGGNSPYSYAWSTGSFQPSIDNLGPGKFYVTITDACSLTKTDSVNIVEPSQLVATNVSKTDIPCYGEGNGAITVNPSGGNSPYTYNWSNGQISQTAVGLFPGTYGVNVFDDKGCLASNSVTISQLAQLAASVTTVNVSCNSGNDGTATANVSGGTSPYTYSWSDSTGIVGTTSQISNLTSQIYSVTITDSCGASLSQSVNITQPEAMSSSIAKTNVTCNGGTNGTANITVTGGVSPITYLWNTGAGSQSLSSMQPGIYYVTATDNCGQTVSDSAIISAPSALSSSIAKENVSCYGAGDGTATVSASGGTSPYTYFWSNNQSTQTAIGLFPGFYSVNVVDANGCLATGNVSIVQSQAISVFISSTYVSCNAGSNGAASAIVSGGTSPYSYLWDDPMGSAVASITGLIAGTYTVSVSDSCGASTVQSVEITQPGELSASLSKNNVSCSGGSNGSASFTVNGGVSPYNFMWSNGASASQINNLPSQTYYVTITDYCEKTFIDSAVISQPLTLTSTLVETDVTCNGSGNGTATVTPAGGTSPFTFLWSNNQTTQSAVGLFAGFYSVNVVDANGCIAANNTSITQPPALSEIISGTHVLCYSGNDGSVSITTMGGTSPYTFLWNTGAMTQNLSSLNAGTYSVTITDSCGASVKDSLEIKQPEALSSIITKTNVTCNGGTNGKVNISVSGGVLPYNYVWSTGTQTQNITALQAGTYFVTTTDYCGQILIDTAEITAPPILTSSIVKTDVSCNGLGDGTATVTPNGGTSPYLYAWNNGQNSASSIGMFAGGYSVNVFDANFCLTTNLINITQPPALSLNISSFPATCGNADGNAASYVTGGTSPYSYLWSTGSANSTASGLENGVFSVTITDAKNCSDSGISTVGVMTIPQEICLVTVDSSNTKNLVTWEKPSVMNIDSFRVYRDIVGTYTRIGTVAYSDLSKFIDNTNGINPSITSYRYKITAVDTCGNESSFSENHKSMHLTKNVGTQGEVNLIWDGYEGFSTVFYYRILIDTGNGIFTAIDSVSNNNFTYTAPPPTTNTQYVIEVVHPSGGCSVTMKSVENHNSSRSNRTNSAPAGSSLSAITESTPASAGNCDGIATVTAMGGLTPYTYQWDGNAGGQTTEIATALCPGTYSVVVYDAAGTNTMVFATIGVMPGIANVEDGKWKIEIFPNPNRGKFTVQIRDNENIMKNLEMKVYNALGEIVYQSKITSMKSEIELNGNGSGVYYVQMVSEKGIITRRLIVE